MPARNGCLALDLASRGTGYAFQSDEPDAPVTYGLWLLRGMSDLGMLYASLRNVLEDAIAVHQPSRLVFVPALFREAQTAARALAGLVAVTEMVAYDNEVRAYECNESTARKAVLGRSNFTQRVAGKIVAGSGSKLAKEAAMTWAREQGWHPQTDDVADALVVLAYDRQMQAGRRRAMG